MLTDLYLYYDVGHNSYVIINKIKCHCNIQNNNIFMHYKPHSNNIGWQNVIDNINETYSTDIKSDYQDLILTYRDKSVPKIAIGISEVYATLGIPA